MISTPSGTTSANGPSTVVRADFFGPNNYEILGDDPVDPVKPDDPAKPKPLTKTGDPLGLGVLGVAGLAAAAGLGAYSARRAANEDARKGKRGED